MTKIIPHVNAFRVLCKIMMIKKIVSFLLLTIYLFSATAVTELLKLPVLAAHFYDHKSKNNNTGFIAFLVQHYCREDGSDKDAAADRQLPFKADIQVAENSFISVNPPGMPHLLPPPVITARFSFRIMNDDCIPSQYLNKVWQPPRQC